MSFFKLSLKTTLYLHQNVLTKLPIESFNQCFNLFKVEN